MRSPEVPTNTKRANSEKINTFDIDLDSADQQIESLKTYKNNRDNNSVSTRLSELKNLAKSDKNIMPGLIKCIHGQCTLGEMSDALREIFGNHEQ